jgi:hypothetical protein
LTEQFCRIFKDYSGVSSLEFLMVPEESIHCCTVEPTAVLLTLSLIDAFLRRHTTLQNTLHILL